jgi:hypothetical protein
MSHDVAQQSRRRARVGRWALIVVLGLGSIGCDPRVFEDVTGQATPSADAQAEAGARDASRRHSDASLDGSVAAQGGSAVGLQPAPSTRDEDAGSDAKAAEAAIESDASTAEPAPSSPDAAVERDLCNQVLPRAPSYSGIVEASIKLLPPIPQHPGITPRGPATSARFGARVLWLFGSAFVRNMGLARAAKNSATLSSFDRPFELDEAQVGALAPATFIPELPADLSTAPDDGLLSFMIGSVIADGPAEALVFYSPSRFGQENGQPVERSLGTRVARIGAGLGGPVAEPQPELIFPASAPSFRSGFVARDNYLYLYGCPQRPDTLYDCLLARAPVGQATSARAYQYRTVGGWSNDLSAAIVVLPNARPELSVSWNPYLRRYLAVHLVWISNQIALQTAERPEGPFTPFGSVSVPEHDAGASLFFSAALEHAELSGKCGKKLVLTYMRPVRAGADTTFELRPIELELR